MGGKFTNRSDFVISSDILDEADWVIDSFIDSLGRNCKIIYPSKIVECSNCIFDPYTGTSSNLYKTGGLFNFTLGETCPVCGGLGTNNIECSTTIKLRVYWSSKDWVKVASAPIVNIPGDVAQIIGYMSDLNKLINAEKIIIENDTGLNLEMRSKGQALPWGFQRRYFVQFLERIVG